jgi:2-keto-3-deoxy-6-phosphogluconate aldolase
MPLQTYLSLEQALVQRIAQAGLVARLRSDQPVDLLLEIGDALLAAPVVVVEVPIEHPEAVAIMTAFAERFGDHLLVGAGIVTSMQQGTMALAAGAQFLCTTRYSTELHQLAGRCGALYLPPATAPAAMPALAQMGVVMATASTVTWLADPVSSTAEMPGIIVHDVTPETLGACAATGATAAAIGDLLFPTAAWSMPTMIRTARHLRHLWMDQ